MRSPAEASEEAAAADLGPAVSCWPALAAAKRTLTATVTAEARISLGRFIYPLTTKQPAARKPE
jgi:hypothetical protein